MNKNIKITNLFYSFLLKTYNTKNYAVDKNSLMLTVFEIPVITSYNFKTWKGVSKIQYTYVSYHAMASNIKDTWSMLYHVTWGGHVTLLNDTSTSTNMD